jgi:hypothetical protein
MARAFVVTVAVAGTGKLALATFELRLAFHKSAYGLQNIPRRVDLYAL